MKLTKLNNMVNCTVDLMVASSASGHPELSSLQKWVDATLALETITDRVTLSVKIVDEMESQSCNASFRNKNKPTNVLSFPVDDLTRETSGFLGDLLLCAPVIAQEAAKQSKPLEAHWAHMVIHGLLHLLGYVHETQCEAAVMEAKEIHLLAKLGYSNPYEA